MRAKIKDIVGKNKFGAIVFILFQIIFFALTSASLAATYYVDYTAGNDSNPGTQAQPWQYCPGMPDWSGSATLSAGDTVYFDSADTWTASERNLSDETTWQLLLPKGGVTYIGNQWGSGKRATFRAEGHLTNALIWFGFDHSTNETIVKGFELDGNNHEVSGIGVNSPNSRRDLLGATKKIEDCVAHDFYARYPDVEYGIKVGGISGHSTKNVSISNCVVFGTPRTGVVIYPSNTHSSSEVQNVNVRNCEVYKTGLDRESAGHGIAIKNNVKNCVIENNYIHDADHSALAITNNSGMIAPQDISIHNNILTRCSKYGVYIPQSGSKSMKIYGNLIFKNEGAGIWAETNLSGEISLKINNNTFYENSGSGVYIANSSANFNALEINNNVIYSHSEYYPLNNISASHEITSHSHNLYYRPGGGVLVRNGGNYYDSDSIKKSWESTALNTDPLFKDTLNLPTGFIGTHGTNLRPNADGLDTQMNSPVSNGGAPLGSTYDESINTVRRPSNSAWDLGAYENSHTDNSLPIVQNLRIIE